MNLRPSLIVGAFVLSAASLGCAAATPSLQPSDLVSPEPTPTDLPSLIPAVAPAPVRTPLDGCPGPRQDLGLILALDPGQRLACFGRSDVTFQATAVATEVDCIPIQIDPAWLWCPPAVFLAAPGSAAFWPGSELVGMTAFVGVPTLEAYAAPGSGFNRAQVVPGAIVLVTGHFDDPAAAACRVVAAQLEPDLRAPTAAEVVLFCREEFVVTSLRPGAA